MKNIHILPTDKPSRLIKSINKGNLYLSKLVVCGSKWTNQNIYITSDEMVKVNDYMTDGIWVDKVRDLLNHPKNLLKKIILTTDQDLIKEGVQAIDDEFLEWFVKNPSCEFVKVEVDLSKHNGEFQTKYGYKIIISKKEPKLEEASKKYAEPYRCPATNSNEYCKHDIISAFNNGAYWNQERSYSKQDMIEFAYKYIDERRDQGARALTPELLIKQFKNK
jgi:hypothetical protein